MQADGQVRRVTQHGMGCGLAGSPFSCTPTAATTRTCRCQTGRLAAASHAYEYGNQMNGGGKAPGCRICLDMGRGWSCGQHVTGDGRAPASLESSGANDHTIWNERRPVRCPGAVMRKLGSAYGTLPDSSGMPCMARTSGISTLCSGAQIPRRVKRQTFLVYPTTLCSCPVITPFVNYLNCARFLWL